MKKTAILIPCFNEGQTIEKVITDFKRELPDAKIYVYDNNSTDNTVQIAESNGAIVRYEKKQGKGNVVRRMFREIDADIYVLIDGDNTYPVSAVHELIAPVENGEADMTVGDRISNGSYKKENKRAFHGFGNRIVARTINSIFNTRLNDIMSGYRVFNKLFVKNVPIMSKKFEIETEITAYALDAQFSIKEIPIEYKDREGNSFSKVNTLSDGMKILRTIIMMLKDYKPLPFFAFIGSLFFIAGIIAGVPVIIEYMKTSYIGKVPSAILAIGCMIIFFICAEAGIILDTIVKNYKKERDIQITKFQMEKEQK